MSGLEVLGAITGVLGVLPVAVEALKTYKSILSSIRNAPRDLARLIRDLETEQVRLRTTCEVLLEGVAPFYMIDGLAEDPFGAAWEQYSEPLRLRLWESGRAINYHTLDMQNAATELREKLAISSDGSAKLADRASIIRELKERASFTLNKKDYIDIILRIKSGNQALSELASQNRGLEPSRRKRSQARLIKLVRGLSHEIFQAIQDATTCSCAASHRVCLELAPRDVVLTPSDIDDHVAQSFKFHVAFESDGYTRKNSTDESCDSLHGKLLNRWSNIVFQLGSLGSNKTPDLSPSLATTIYEPLTPPKSPRLMSLHRRNKSSKKSVVLVKEVDTQLAIPQMDASSQLVTDLCYMLTRRDKQPVMNCLGYITNIDRSFGIYPPTLHLDCCAILTLREILEGERLNVAQFNYPEKLRVALAIAVSTLHLHSTPWVEESLTLDNVIFFVSSSGDDLDTVSLDRPFVVKNLLTPHSKQNTPLDTPRPVNQTVFSLGALLIQVMIGKPESVLEMPKVTDNDAIFSRLEAGKQLFDRLLESGGINYKTAVEWCFNNALRVARLQNDDCCQQIFQEVVSRLEQDVRLLSEN